MGLSTDGLELIQSFYDGNRSFTIEDIMGNVMGYGNDETIRGSGVSDGKK